MVEWSTMHCDRGWSFGFLSVNRTLASWTKIGFDLDFVCSRRLTSIHVVHTINNNGPRVL